MSTKKARKRDHQKQDNPKWFDKFINGSTITDFESGLFKKVDFEKMANWLKRGTAEARAQRDRFFSMLCNVEYLY